MNTTISLLPAYAGLDVGKERLHLTILRSLDQVVLQTDFANDPAGRQSLVRLCREHHIALLVMEHTGGLELDAAAECADAQIPVSIVTPLQSKSFAKTLQQHAKTDPLDSHLLALFALKIQPQVTQLPSAQQRELSALASRRRQLVDLLIQEKNRRQRAAHPRILKSIDAVIRTLEKQLRDTDQLLADLIAADATLLARVACLDSTPGIGPNSATALVVACPELGTLNRQEAAALAGVAPYNKDSGKTNGPRSIKGGRKNIRYPLYMITLSAIRCCPQIKALYQHHRTAGKKKMVALVACMRKLFIMLNSMVRQNKSWQEFVSINP